MKTTDHAVLAKVVAKSLLPKVNGYITSSEIAKRINIKLQDFNRVYGTNFKKEINGADVRDIINYIRTNNLFQDGEILANSKGYFISKYQDEILEYCQSWLRRIESQMTPLRFMQERAKKYSIKPINVIEQGPIEGDLFDNI